MGSQPITTRINYLASCSQLPQLLPFETSSTAQASWSRNKLSACSLKGITMTTQYPLYRNPHLQLQGFKTVTNWRYPTGSLRNSSMIGRYTWSAFCDNLKDRKRMVTWVQIITNWRSHRFYTKNKTKCTKIQFVTIWTTTVIGAWPLFDISKADDFNFQSRCFKRSNFVPFWWI